jgi:polysaccharide chain length determinant protein (PEP-CTERM system associated)
MENAEGLNLKDVVEIAKRRKWGLLLPALAVFLLAAVIAMALPSIYRSTSTILIEVQEIPPELVMSTVTSYAEQRLQMINQRIMSATKLLDIIGRFNLYADLKARKATEEIVDKMRKDIKLETISADVVDRRTGSPKQATIAFSLSYSGKQPAVVQQITNVLTSFYLEENLKVREQQTTGTRKFFEDEMKGIQASLARIDGKISEYKRNNLASLPELIPITLSEQTQADSQILHLGEQLRSLKEKESYLQEQLAATTQEDVNPDKVRLNELRARLVDLRSRYSEEYPDVRKANTSIAELEKQLKASDNSAVAARLSNPIYANVASQLAGTKSEIESSKRQIELFREKRDGLRRNFAASPRVEEGFKAFYSERANLQAKYDDLSRKFMEAKVAHGLEKEQMGERFTIIDAARFPEKPVSPNRPAILLIGLILGIGSGIGVASLQEFGDRSARSADALARATGFPVLAGIPEIVTGKEIAARKSKRRLLLAGGTAAVLVGLAIVHFFIMDIDIVLAKVARRMNG